jgi:hypothetical protein
MTGLQAALAEATGDGNFTITGRRLIYTRGKFEIQMGLQEQGGCGRNPCGVPRTRAPAHRGGKANG